MPPVIDPQKCLCCGMCADICNSQIFSFIPSHIPEVRYPDECWHCDSCVLDCQAQAIHLRIPLSFMLHYVDADTLKPGE